MGGDQIELGNSGDKVRHIIVGGGGDNFLRRADLHQGAVLHNGDAVADADGLVQVVGDKQGGFAHALRERHELVLQLAADERVEGGKRLVHQQDGRVGGQRARQPDSLLHSAGEFVGIALGPSGQFDGVDGALGGFAALFLVVAANFQRKGHILPHRLVGEQRHVLEDHSDFARADKAQGGVAHRADILALNQDLSGGGLYEPVDVADEGGLAGAGKPHNAKDFAALHDKGGVADADDAAVFLPRLVLADFTGAGEFQDLGGLVAENLPQIAAFNNRSVGVCVSLVFHRKKSSSAGARYLGSSRESLTQIGENARMRGFFFALRFSHPTLQNWEIRRKNGEWRIIPPAMKIQSIRLKNFKMFKDVVIRDIPPLAVFVGANGSGKSTLFDVFGFLRDTLTYNAQIALRMNDRGGFGEMRTRNEVGPIEIELKFRAAIKGSERLITYAIAVQELNKTPIIEEESLSYKRGRHGKPFKFLDFRRGRGQAVADQDFSVPDIKLTREDQVLGFASNFGD